MTKLLQVRDLEVQFNTKRGCVYAVNNVSFDLDFGETLGIVGESGCGKSTLMLSLLGLLPSPPCRIIAGHALYEGENLLGMVHKRLRALRGHRIGVIFQDPMTSFNPVLTVGYQVAEPLKIHLGMSVFEAEQRVVRLFDMVGIPNPKERIHDFPHQFSGGMRQRVMIATALACKPDLLVADEPTTALDVTIQAQIVELIKGLRGELNMAVVWITHDLALLAGLAHRMIVMYGGIVVEEAPVNLLYTSPRHPYTLGLLGSLPRMDSDDKRPLASIEGTPPIISHFLDRCPFAPRCAYRKERCECSRPPLQDLGSGHKVACWLNSPELCSGEETP